MKKATVKASSHTGVGIEGFESLKDIFGTARKSLEEGLESTGESIKSSILSAKESTTEEFESLKETAADRVSEAKENTAEKFAPLTTASREQLHALRDETRDIKKIFQSKDLTFYKTEAFAIVLRKLGGLPEFLEECDKLTKEGYRLVFREPVETLLEIPVPGVHTPLGTFYYFQHIKYITR